MHSLSCHLPCMLKIIEVHQLVVLASVVVAREGGLHTTQDHVAILIRIGIGLAELIEIFKITPFKLYKHTCTCTYYTCTR